MTPPFSEQETLLLIVDDEPLITDLFTRAMTKRGFQVLSAVDGESALAIVKSRASDLSLVITDMTMPGMDGIALAQALEHVAPSLPVLIATGYDADISQMHPPANVVDIVQKPYQTTALFDTIRTIVSVEDLP